MNPFTTFDYILLLLLITTVTLFILIEAGSVKESPKHGAKPSTALLARWIRRVYPENLIRQCGLPPQKSQPLYWAVKVFSATLCTSGAFAFFREIPLWQLLIINTFGFHLCDLWLHLKRNSRKARIKASLLFFMELLHINLQSGFNLARSFRLAAEFGLSKNSDLAKETLLIASELDAGRDRKNAFLHLSQRTGVSELNRLAAVIELGHTVGAPIASALESQVKLLRSNRNQEHNRALNRKSLETLIPMFAISFPMFIALVFFPASIQIMNVLNLIGEIL